jgi:aminoglycoside phosphotransferase (APT) family kinase protein
MIPGAPEAARWVRSSPRRTLPADVLNRLVRTAFPGCCVVDIAPCEDGFRNANFKVRLDRAPDVIVLRIYEHDPSLCQKEVDLIGLVRGSVPVPEVLHAEPPGFEGLPPFVMLRFVDGITFRDLERSGDRNAIAQAARSMGETLAVIGRIVFPKPGWLGPGPGVGSPLLEGEDSMPRFVDLCLASTNLQHRVPDDLRSQTHALVWSRAPQLAALENEARLVHGDFNRRNTLVRFAAGQWSVAAVLDWEFAVSGAPLADVANFLRHECAECPLVEPHFSNGYREAGGTLPDAWRRLARQIDLVALCDSLTRDDLPDEVVEDLVELVCATVRGPPAD